MQALIKFATFTILLSTVGCAGFGQRSFLSDLGGEGGSYFNPRENFPVVSGDTGEEWEAEEERYRRTPATENEMAEERNRKFFQNELQDLESQQSELSTKQYERYKNRLVTTSEKIYFLKLSPHDRKEYLISRGFMDMSRSPASVAVSRYTSTSGLSAGMSKDDVMGSWGKPTRVEIAGNPSFQNERWLYNADGASKYIYFESGKVEGWE